MHTSGFFGAKAIGALSPGPCTRLAGNQVLCLQRCSQGRSRINPPRHPLHPHCMRPVAKALGFRFRLRESKKKMPATSQFASAATIVLPAQGQRQSAVTFSRWLFRQGQPPCARWSVSAAPMEHLCAGETAGGSKSPPPSSSALTTFCRTLLVALRKLGV